MESKTCNKCDLIKPITDYYVCKTMTSGRLNSCKLCISSNVRKNRGKNIEYYREYDRARGNRQSSGYLKEHRNKNPNQYKAHKMVGYAIRSGKLFKEPCEVCKVGETHAHHDDYLKPLNVRWLCAVHHKLWHTENGSAKNSV